MADLGEVGSASVALRVEMKKLRTELGSARKTIASEGNKAGKAFSAGFLRGSTALKGALAGLLTGAAIKGLIRGTETAIKKLDEIGKTADSIGVATDALQELRVAADLSGISTAELDTGLKRFARAAYEASQGTKEYADTFEALGVSVTDTNGRLLPVDQLLGKVADSFQGLDNATQKAAVAQDLFGRSGVRLVNLLNDGSQAIEEMRQKARDLGIVIDENLIRSAEDLNDKLSLVKQTIDAELTQAMVRAGPLVLDLARALAVLATWAANAWEGLRVLSGFTARDPVLRFGQVNDELGEVNSKLEATRASIADLQDLTKKPITAANAPLTLGDNGLEVDMNAALDERSSRIAEQQDEVASLEQRQAALIAERATLLGSPPELLDPPDVTFGSAPSSGGGGGGGTASKTAAISDQQRAYDALTESILDSINATQAEREEIGVETQAVGQSQEAHDRLMDALNAERLEREILNYAAANGLDVNSQEIQQLLQMSDALKKVTAARTTDAAALREHQDEAQAAAEKEQALAGALNRASDQFIDAALTGGDFTGILQNLIIELIKVELQALETGDSIGGIFGSSGGGGIFDSVLGFLGIGGSSAPTSSPIPVPRGFADGGLPPVGKFSLVGESGPELAYFGQQARVFSNDDLASALAGSPDRATFGSVTFNISAPDRKTGREAAGSVERRLAEMARRGQGYL